MAPENVLVLYNANAASGGDNIAGYYADIHPGVHLLPLTNVGLGEEILADDYLRDDGLDNENVNDGIRRQVLDGLTDLEGQGYRIDVIVTTKGLPLRVRIAQANPSSYTDPNGVERLSYTWQAYSSLESELARIDTISTWQQMGDQTYWLPEATHHARNPYYGAETSFDHETYGTRLTSRLDGFTVEDVKSSIDRAQRAFLYPSASVTPVVIEDDDPNGHYDQMLELNDQLMMRDQPTIFDRSSSAVTTSQRNVIGYVSHGTHSSELFPNYIPQQLDFSLADGAVFHTRESFNAITFAEDETQSQGLVAEWIAAGGTVGVGHVQEPGNSKETVTNEDMMFAMLLDGYTWAEAAWSATYQLSYVNTVVGDPLMTFKEFLLGDANMDGIVDIVDLGQVSSNYGLHDESGEIMWSRGEFDGDGVVDITDLGIIASHWGAVSDWYVVNTAEAIPEPSALMLAFVGIVTLSARRKREPTSQDGCLGVSCRA
ncbi:MAG: TIGR03790 family protein [Pirellulales bacterium]|nr:TIGR03790 family protein [Pirellulales bacterium]